MSKAKVEIVTLRCQVCAANTKHEITCSLESIAAPAQTFLPWQQAPLFVPVQAQILECQECANISFRQSVVSAFELGQITWTSYPSPRKRMPFSAAGLLPANIGKIYHETLLAIAGNCFVLAAAGMRAVVEAICQMHGCKGQDLRQRISKLKGLNGVLSTREASALHTHRAFGNEALHKMRAPSAAETDEALEILEHILRTLYELPYRTDNLARMREGRNMSETTLITPVLRAG